MNPNRCASCAELHAELEELKLKMLEEISEKTKARAERDGLDAKNAQFRAEVERLQNTHDATCKMAAHLESERDVLKLQIEEWRRLVVQRDEAISGWQEKLGAKELQVGELRGLAHALDLFVGVYEGKVLDKDAALHLIQKYAKSSAAIGKEIVEYQDERSVAKRQLSALRKLALESVVHYYEGGCPTADAPDARDPNCPACKIVGPITEKQVCICERVEENTIKINPACKEHGT